MDPRMMTRPAGKLGNNHPTYHNHQQGDFPTQFRKSQTQMISNNVRTNNRMPSLLSYKTPTNGNSKHHMKPTSYPKAKNVGSKVFKKEYEYPESVYVVKPSAKPQYKVSPDRTAKNLSGCSTMPSEEELPNSHLYGFRIVHDGKTLHDETQGDDVDTVLPLKQHEINDMRPQLKYASSLYNIGPNPKEIALPSFMDG